MDFYQSMHQDHMKHKITLYWFLLCLISACGTPKHIFPESHDNRPPACGGNYDVINKGIILNPISTIVIHSIIKSSDTTQIDDFFCSDSITFTKAFQNLDIHASCLEMQIEGNTYYSVQINDNGGFENFRTLRTVDPCFDYFDKRVASKLNGMKALSTSTFNTELIFYHKFRIEY